MKKILTFYTCLLVLLSGTRWVDAANGTWNQTTGGPYTWNTGANWTGGIPNGTNDIANLNTANLTSNLTINLDISVFLDILQIGDTDATHGYTITPTAGQTITFNNTDPVAALLTKNGAFTDTINASMIVNDNLDAAINNGGTLILGGAISINGNLVQPAQERLSKTGDGTLRLAGNTTLGSNARITTSNGTLDMRGAFNLLSSEVETTGGTANIRGLYNVFNAASGDNINVSGSGTMNFAPVTTNFTSGATTSGSPTVTVADTTALVVGQQVFGTGIPAGTTVQSITNGTTFVLSANATATNTNQTFVASTPNFSYIAGVIDQSGGTLRFGLDNATANGTFYASQLSKTGGTLQLQFGTGLGTTTVLGGSRITPANPTTVTSGNTTIPLNNTTGLLVGMRVYGPGIPANAIISSVTANTSIVISAAPTATNSNVSLMFGEGIQNVAATTTSGSNVVNVTNTAGLAVGMVVSGTNIPEGATITAINPGVSITLSTGANATATGGTTLNTYVVSTLTLDGGTTEIIGGGGGAGTGSGTINFDPSIKLLLTDSATLNFSDSTGTQQNFTFYSLNSNSLTSIVRADRGSATLTVGNYSGVDDTFLGRLLMSGSTSKLSKVGSNTLTLGGNTDNSATRVDVLEGTVVLAKDSSPTVHALGANSTIGNIDAAVETMKIGGTMTPYAFSQALNLKDQIYFGLDMTVLATGVLDLNGNSEGFNGLSGAGSVVNNMSGTTSTLILGENNSGATVDTLIRDNTIGTGIVSLIKSGSGTMLFTANNTYTGTTLIGRGQATLTGANGAFSGSSSIRVADSTLYLLNTTNNNANRINDAGSLVVSNGTFTVSNNSSGATSTTETIGNFTADKGHDILRVDHANAVSNTVRIHFGTYSRNGGSQVSIVENTTTGGFGTGVTPNTALSQVTVGTIPVSLMIGGGGSSSTGADPTLNLLLGAFGGNNSNNTNEFMTVQDVGGVFYIRPLNNGGAEYAEIASGTIGSQVGKATANKTISANTSYNSLRYSGNTVTTIANDKALKLGGNTDANFGANTVGAGMMIFAGTTTITGGYLDFGVREAILRANSGGTIQSTITGTNALFGFTKSGGGQLDMAGANTYSGETVIGQGLLRVLRSGALGLGGTNNGTSIMGNQTLALASGVIVGHYDAAQTAKREGLTMGPNTILAGYDQNNVWGGDVILDAASESGQNSNTIFRPFSDTAVISINGRVSGGGSDVDPSYSGAGGRYLYLDGNDKRESVININGAISDENFGSALLSDSQKLNIVVRGTTNAGNQINEFHVNLQDASKVHGSLDLRSGFVRINGEYGTDTQFGVTQNIVMRLRDSGTDSPHQFAALLMNKADVGSTSFDVANIQWGDNTGGYSAYSYGMLGTELTNGVVTIGNGTGSLDLTPTSDASGASFLNLGGASGTGGSNLVTVDAQDIGKLRIGMNLVASSNISGSTYIISINYATNVVTLNTGLTGTGPINLAAGSISFNDMIAGLGGTTQQYADARLYAAEGGTLNLKMRLIDEGGFSLDNEVGAVTKVGRGDVRLSGSTAGNGSLDGGLNLHSGRLILDYSINNNRKITEGSNVQAPLTLAGGDLVLQGNPLANTTEEMRGILFMRPGESLIHVKSGGGGGFTTTLNLGLPSNLIGNAVNLPARYAGSSMVFRRDNSPGGNSTITLEVPDIYTGVVALPWALWADPATGKVTDFAYIASAATPTEFLFIKDAGGNGLFLSENNASYMNNDLVDGNGGAFKHYIAESDSEIVAGEGTGFFGTYVPSATKNQGDANSIGNLMFNVDNDNLNGSDYVNNLRPDPNNELKIAPGETLILKSNLTTGYLGGAILIANTVGDTNKKLSGGSISSGLVTSYFDPNVANTLVKTYDLLIHNYAEAADLVTPANGGGIFTIESDIVNNPTDVLTPLNLVHNGTGWTKMARATSVGAGYSYTGKTFFNGGTVWVSDVNKLGADTAGTVSDRYYFTGGRLLVGDLTNPTGTSLGSLTLDSRRGITIGGDGAFINIANASTTLTYTGLISVEVQAPTFAAGIIRTSNIGLGDLFKEGAGKLVLSNAAHTYSGVTSVDGGILQVNINTAASVTNQNAGYLGSNYSFIDGTFLKSGGRLDLQITGGATNGTSEWITLDGGTLGTTASHLDGTLDGVIRVRQNSTVDVVGTGTLRFNSTAGYLTSSGATGTPTLTKAGTGTLLLFENNTEYAGNWAVNQGRVVGVTQGLAYGTGSAMSLGDGSGSGVAEALMSSRTTPTVTVSGIANGTNVTVGSTAGLYVGMPITGGTIPANSVITAITSGTTFTINNSASVGNNTYTATLNFNNPMDYHVGNNITVSSGAQVKRIGASNHTVIANSGQQNDRYNYDGTIALTGNLLVSYEDNVANTGIGASGRDQFIALNGNISGAGSLTTEITYTGNTVADQNDLRITTELNGDNTAWTGGISTGNASNDADLQHLVRLGNNNALKSDNSVTMGFNSTLQVGGKDVTMGNLLITPTGNATTNQVIVENASNTAGKLTITQTTNEDWDVLFRDGTTPAVYSAIAPTVRDNTLSIAKAGTGTAVMTQTNTYTGSTSLVGGILRVTSLVNGGIASNIGASSNAAANLVYDGGTLEYTGAATSTDRNYTVTTNGGSLAASGSGALTVSGNMTASGSSGSQTFTLTGTSTAVNTLSGTINNGTGTNVTSLSKTGAGTWALTNANTYSGTTTISAGTLLANNTTGSATGTSIVSVTTGTLGGTGIVAGNTTVNSGGTLLIGNVTGDVSSQDLQFNGTLNSSGTLALDLWSYSAGGNGSADILRFGTNVAISLTGTLQVTNLTGTSSASFINGSAWQLIDWTNVTTPANRNVNFSTLSLPALTGGLTWNTSALNTTGFISISVVPEPGRAMLLFIGLLWMIGGRRRRQA